MLSVTQETLQNFVDFGTVDFQIASETVDFQLVQSIKLAIQYIKGFFRSTKHDSPVVFRQIALMDFLLS